MLIYKNKKIRKLSIMQKIKLVTKRRGKIDAIRKFKNKLSWKIIYLL